MEYLDPEKQRRHGILLLVGYVFIAIAVVTATIVLVYQAYGYGVDRNGTVIQNGIVFVSSHPNPAKIYLDGKINKADTNARLALPANNYKLRLTREGYQDWQRTIEVNGGSVTHFDYPFLFPKAFKTTPLAALAAVPNFSTQSLDRRWIILATPGEPGGFQLYDLKTPTKPVQTLTLPATALVTGTDIQPWQLGEWASDNVHVLLHRLVDGKLQFVLLNRENPDQSISLNQTLNADPTAITLNDKKYDQYYVYNDVDHSLQTASIASPVVTPYLSDVLAYKSYGSSQVLYFTSADAPAGKALLRLQDGTKSTLLRSFPASSHYLVDTAKYNGTFYVVASSADENKIYIYKDPVAQLANRVQHVIVPIQVLRVTAPDYESFSSNAQYIVAEHGSQLAVYDLQNKTGYSYTLTAPLDIPQAHVQWMDGNRLTYVSGGILQIFDYDHQNLHRIVASTAGLQPFFAPDYKNLYTIITATSGASLSVTPLLTPADL